MHSHVSKCRKNTKKSKWETTEKINLIDIKVKKETKQKRKTKVIKGKQLKLNQFSLNNFTEQQQSKANILKFQRDKQTLFGLL